MSFLYKYYNCLDYKLLHNFYKIKIQEINKSFVKKENFFGSKNKKLTENLNKLDNIMFGNNFYYNNYFIQEKDNYVMLYKFIDVWYDEWVYYLCKQNFFNNIILNLYCNILSFNFINKYKNSFHSKKHTLWINVKNKVNNSFVALFHNEKNIYINSIGKISFVYKEEKYGHWLLSRKMQRFLLFYKLKKKHQLKNIIIQCLGLKRFFRVTLGHLTQLIVRLFKRYKKILIRYKKWLLKFLRISLRTNKMVLMTHRQRIHTYLLNKILKAKSYQIFYLSQLRLVKSYNHSKNKVKKREGKYNFGY
jgi:hypothetical protein